MHESNRPACVWLLLLMTPESGWEWGGVEVGILGIPPYAILTWEAMVQI